MCVSLHKLTVVIDASDVLEATDTDDTLTQLFKALTDNATVTQLDLNVHAIPAFSAAATVALARMLKCTMGVVKVGIKPHFKIPL